MRKWTFLYFRITKSGSSLDLSPWVLDKSTHYQDFPFSQVCSVSIVQCSVKIFSTGKCCLRYNAHWSSLQGLLWMLKNYSEKLVFILVRILQRSRTNRVHRDKSEEILLQELAHLVTEAENSYNMSSVSWRTKNASGIIQS